MQGLLIAQALMEYGLLGAMAAGLTRAWYQIDALIGRGRSTYVIVSVLIFLAFVLTRRRR